MFVVSSDAEFQPGTTQDIAIKDLTEKMIPGIKQAPGFVKAQWFGDEKTGHSLMTFETEDQAKAAIQPVGEVFFGVKITGSVVYRLHAEA